METIARAGNTLRMFVTPFHETPTSSTHTTLDIVAQFDQTLRVLEAGYKSKFYIAGKGIQHEAVSTDQRSLQTEMLILFRVIDPSEKRACQSPKQMRWRRKF